MSRGFPWGDLGITRTADVASIRRAYADRLKAMDTELDADAFARLRSARDVALRQAKAGEPSPVAVPEPDASEAFDAADMAEWRYAAPVISAIGESVPPDIVTVPAPTMGEPVYDSLPVGRSAAEPSLARLAITNPFFTPVLTSTPDAVKPVQRPDARLRSLLLANGKEDDTPLSDEEEGEARACLRTILADASAGNLARHNAAEAWLADLMVQSWPRCAPLLEETAQTFGWSAQNGRLGESTAIAYLNARLSGYLFQRDVQSVESPFHKAWIELSKPGRAGINRHLAQRVYPLKRQIAEVLAHIRKNFPEIENFLDPQRVVSWEASFPPPKRWQFRVHVFAIIIGLRLLGALADYANEQHQQAWPTTISTSPAASDPLALPRPIGWPDPAVAAAKNAAVLDAFGPGKTLAWVRRAQPDLGDWIDGFQVYGDPANVTDNMIREIRRRAYVASWTDGGPELEAFMRARAGLMTAALHAGPGACIALLQTDGLPANVKIPPSVRTEEQQLDVRLVEAGKLTLQPRPGATHADVPGVLVGQVMAMTGFNRNRVAHAMQTPTAGSDRCAVDAALIRATLSWHGVGKTAILRTL